MKVADLTYLLVPRLYLGTHIRRICLPSFQSFPATNEADPLEIGSQAEPWNQLILLGN